MSIWSEELQEETRKELFLCALVKDESHNYGIVTEIGKKIIIQGVENGGSLPAPNGEIIATFDSVDNMIDAGWVLD